LQGLQEFGWTADRNVRIDYRWAGDDVERRRSAAELVALAPDVLLASTSPSVAALQQVTRTIPIVFAAVTARVGQGFVASLARPGGNTTGFALYEYGIGAKWLELLKEIAPGVRRSPHNPVRNRPRWGCLAARRSDPPRSSRAHATCQS